MDMDLSKLWEIVEDREAWVLQFMEGWDCPKELDMTEQLNNDRAKESWYFHLLKKFSQFVVIHTVKGLE